MMLGLSRHTHPRELVKLGRNILNGAIPPKLVKTGPVKENILKSWMPSAAPPALCATRSPAEK